jgi:hypothetical protein
MKGENVNSDLQNKFAQANGSLQDLAKELETGGTMGEIDLKEITKLRMVVDRVRMILWQMQQSLDQRSKAGGR